MEKNIALLERATYLAKCQIASLVRAAQDRVLLAARELQEAQVQITILRHTESCEDLRTYRASLDNAIVALLRTTWPLDEDPTVPPVLRTYFET